MLISLFIKKSFVFVACLLPFIYIFFQAFQGRLGPDVGSALVLFTGLWSLRFLVLTLAASSLRRVAQSSFLLRHRRMLGLYAWFYASLHMFCVLLYLLGWSWSVFVEEFSERPYMALGISAWLLMVPLGLTSNRWMQRRMKRRWKQLHQLVYLIALLACAHFIWLVRSDYAEPLFYSLLIVILLGERVVFYLRNSRVVLK